VTTPDPIGGTEIIAETGCWDLLETQGIGRVAVCYGGQVDIFPVNYGLDGEGILFRTNAGRKMSAASSGEIAFEVDDIDARAKTGWSVVIHGQARDITIYDGLERQRAAQPWTGSKDFLFRIAPRSITGRRTVPSRLAGSE
jgi:nitroimidazol reductase NimA-like FMN-containing flavoprotein (pyridoxamine 5'-phosphate oxidase superfamily)